MIKFKYLTLVFIFAVNCDAELQLNITTSSTKLGTRLKFNGTNDKYISETDIRLFNITSDNLNHGFRVQLGKKPDSIFLNDPTPYGKLFKKFKWKESKRSIFIQSAKVYDVINENVVVKSVNNINNTTNEQIVHIRVFEGIENTVSSTWSKDGIGEEVIPINVTINFGTNEFLAKNNLTYLPLHLFRKENKWRHKNYHSFSLQFGTKYLGKVKIGVGKQVIMELTAKKTIIILKIVYVAHLTGLIIGNYANLYGKYHYYSPAINDIMKAARLKNYIKTTEMIEIKCYTDPKITLYDKDTGELVTIEHKGPLYPKTKVGNLRT